MPLMAIEQPTSAMVSVTEPVRATTREERTRRAIIEVPRDGAYSVWVYREEVLRAADGKVLRATEIAAPVHRLASAITDESVTLADGTVITAAQIIESLPGFFDRWATEDAAR